MSEPHPAQPGHETKDVNSNAVFGLAGLAIVLGIAIGLGVWFVFQDLRERQSRRLSAPFPVAVRQPGMVLPPQPRLEGIERMKGPGGESRPQELQPLNNYEWVDRRAGVVRIPMDRAMAIIVEKKLIASSEKSTARDLRNPYARRPSPANSGRTPEKEQP